MFIMLQPIRLAWFHPVACGIAACLLASCSGGAGAGNNALSSNLPPDMLVCRARLDSPHRYSEMALRTTRNLGNARIGDRIGPERHARLHPDGARVVFSRERNNDDADTREIYVSTIDGSAAELRLTINSVSDDDPVWSPDGNRILHASTENGGSGLFLCSDTGADRTPFLPTTGGFSDSQPDWHRGSDRVVFSRRDPSGQHTLWLVNGSGFGEIQLTDAGLATGNDNGDREPSFSPDGSLVVFVRRFSSDRAKLMVCAVATATVTEVFAPTGDLCCPRFAPTMDRFWFGLAEPDSGRQTLRLAHLPISGGAATLAWPDERWILNGIDFLSVAAAPQTAGSPVRLDANDVALQVAAASNSFGAAIQLREDDDNEFYLRTIASGPRQVAAINCRFALPIETPEEVVEVQVRAIVRASRIDGDSVFRMSIRNLTDNRYDTVVELTPTSTNEHILEFRTSSLRHIAREKELQFTVIADLAEGDREDVWIDMVEVILVPELVP